MLKRAFILISGTITGLVGVLSYNPPNLAGAMVSPPQESQPTEVPQAASTKPETKNSAAPSRKPAMPTKKSVTQSNQSSTPAQSTASTAKFQGDVASTKYGPVQVQITVSNGQITNAEALAYPTRDRRSIQISQAVVPWLVQETVRLQSSSIMAVSGATFTTNAWNQSLASALQKAGK